MDRGTRNLFALVMIVVIAITGGAALLLSDIRPAPIDSNAPGDGSFITGVVVDVDSRSLTDVRSFRLRLGNVVSYFVVGELENAAEFPPGHLLEHQATAQPVRAYYRLEREERVVYRLEDAGP